MSLIAVTEVLNTEQENANVVGEALRNYFFENEPDSPWPKSYKQLGCYETFRSRADADSISKRRASEMFSEYSGWSEVDGLNTIGYSFDVGKTRMYVVWAWDGDGCLIFIGPDFVLVNDDCKKTEGWYYVPREWPD